MKRDAATLISIIKSHIRPGTTIISDCWKAYCELDNMTELYSHYTVNHSENFVDPTTSAHTQTIEGTWSHFKARHKEERGTYRSLFGSYIAQFCWRRIFAGTDVMYHLWSQIKSMYPLDENQQIEDPGNLQEDEETDEEDEEAEERDTSNESETEKSAKQKKQKTGQ